MELTFYFLFLEASEEGFSHRVIPAGAPAAHTKQEGVVFAPAVKAHPDFFAKYAAPFLKDRTPCECA